MKYQIKKRFTAEIMFEGEADSFSAFVEQHKANLSEADLYGANLYKADLSEADLSGVDLYGANLYKADLYGANLSEANLSGVDLYGAKIKVTQKEELLKALKIEIVE